MKGVQARKVLYEKIYKKMHHVVQLTTYIERTARKTEWIILPISEDQPSTVQIIPHIEFSIAVQAYLA